MPSKRPFSALWAGNFNGNLFIIIHALGIMRSFTDASIL